ncbi:Serine hydrolase-like protein [Pseudolycoriella hygida]|uniref:Serine hydrolase-like protein n=1 Tax=Pseudolycoriella hygida TaxID=35572 RepID=A0A9Q0MM32_9DIPT|nr:Serine hydrolase-like protein [Pseudolycoriella hygida]
MASMRLGWCRNFSQFRKSNSQFSRVHTERFQSTATKLELPEVEEIQIKFSWGHVAGKWWGPRNVRPIVSLHGWQDNAGTFDTLIPLLPRHMSYLALDLPGHGLSSHIPDGVMAHQNQEHLQNIREVEEIKISVPWGYIAAKYWGPRNVRPILCLHGWQDNAGTFDALIPMLPDHVSYLVIDFPGHGLSSRYPNGMIYSHVDYLYAILLICKKFEWEKLIRKNVTWWFR